MLKTSLRVTRTGCLKGACLVHPVLQSTSTQLQRNFSLILLLLSVRMDVRMTITAILLVIATTASSVLADECPNRNYCHTPGIKYRSFQQMPGMFLNSTNYVLRTFQTNTSGNCLNECTRTENCQSTNYYLETNKTVMSCDLINGNKWSNASLLVNKENSTHNFIEVL